MKSLALELHPLILTLPACLGISMVYFLPVSTPPNAIVTQYAHIKTKYFVSKSFTIIIINYRIK